MIHTGVARNAADKMVAEGARILKHYRDAEGNALCDVEDAGNGDAGQPPPPPPAQAAEEPPKKRGRPRKTASNG